MNAAAEKAETLFIAEWAWRDVHLGTHGDLDIATLLLEQVRLSGSFVCLLNGPSPGGRDGSTRSGAFDHDLREEIILNKLECTFRLLQPASSLTPPDAPSIELCGSRWVLNEYAQLSDGLAYTCISYVWEQEKTEHWLNDGQFMSARTIPVIEAAIKASRSPKNWANVQFSQDQQKDAVARVEALNAAHAFWIDAICIPTQDAARASSLRNMGAIYSSAWQVFVVLSASSSIVLHQIRDTGRLDPNALFILESDEWITRSWTYQEIVNSRALYFIVQDDESTIVSGVDFLSAVLTATDDYRSTHGIDSLTWGEQHPKLDSLECLIADYKIAQYAERSAYQVMSAMHARFSERIDDHFYAMIGAIAISSLDIQDDEFHSPSEYFMQTCEAKGDYSFLYSEAPRNEIYGRRWRPIEGKFPPVLPELLIFGTGQSGSLKPTHIQLENMCRLVTGTIGSDGLKATRGHLAMVHRHRPKGDTYSSPSDVADAILELLKTRGFSGCGEYLELENGFFFSQSKPARSDDIFVSISIDVHWAGGGPGMLLRSNDTGINDFCDVGAFIGRIPKNGESICVG